LNFLLDRLRHLVLGHGLFGFSRRLPTSAGYTGWNPEATVNRISSDELLRAGGLFVMTIGTTWLTGGWQYAAAIMLILLCHEMGHYLMCRRYRVSATLPLFIPMPLISIFGTMGAIIRMKANIENRRVLFDIGIAGPLAGLGPALVALFWGLSLSTVVALDPNNQTMIPLGDSLLLRLAESWFYPGLQADQDILLHPLAFAGWAGLFVTALNLIPVGQLDGGHVLYGLLGKRSFPVGSLVLIGLGIGAVFYPAWWLWFALMLVFGFRHPETVDEHIPLDRGRVALGIFALIVFIFCFVPQPFSVR